MARSRRARRWRRTWSCRLCGFVYISRRDLLAHWPTWADRCVVAQRKLDNDDDDRREAPR